MLRSASTMKDTGYCIAIRRTTAISSSRKRLICSNTRSLRFACRDFLKELTMWQSVRNTEPVYAHQRQVRAKYPRARLTAVYSEAGQFKAWRIINGDSRISLSGHFPDHEQAWEDAAKKLSGV